MNELHDCMFVSIQYMYAMGFVNSLRYLLSLPEICSHDNVFAGCAMRVCLGLPYMCQLTQNFSEFKGMGGKGSADPKNSMV